MFCCILNSKLCLKKYAFINQKNDINIEKKKVDIASCFNSGLNSIGFFIRLT